jgi:hypothetical protein
LKSWTEKVISADSTPVQKKMKGARRSQWVSQPGPKEAVMRGAGADNDLDDHDDRD